MRAGSRSGGGFYRPQFAGASQTFPRSFTGPATKLQARHTRGGRDEVRLPARHRFGRCLGTRSVAAGTGRACVPAAARHRRGGAHRQGRPLGAPGPRNGHCCVTIQEGTAPAVPCPAMAIDEEPAAPISAEAPTDAAAPARPARKRHVTRGILILMILTVAGVVAPFVAAIFARHSGASLDSTRVFQVSIRNDTAAPLDAQLCSDRLSTVQKVSILPGD